MAKKRSVIHITDFSGGYSSDLPDERMADNMLRTGLNVYWESGLKKRTGISEYTTTFPYTMDIILGISRAYMNSKWVTLIAGVDENDPYTVKFFTDITTPKTFVEIDSGFRHEYDSIIDPDRYRFELFKVNGEDAVCAVDGHGVEKPFMAYYDSGMVIKNIEEYDLRTRTKDDWYAGTYDVSEDNPYFDKTAGAQSDTADTFPLTSSTNGDGFYVAGVLTFNKFTIHSPSEFDGSPVAVYEYYQGDDTWAALTMVQTPVWGTGTTDKTFEFDYPQAWAAWDGANAQDTVPSEIEGTLLGRYVIRVRFTTAPTSAQTADNLTVYHSQYLTQIMAGDIPHQIGVHLSRLFLAAGSNVNYSPPGRLTDWFVYDTESFIKGGDKIQAMVSIIGTLVIIKETMLYGLLGNSVENWVIKELDSTVGSHYHASVAVINRTMFFIGSDGYIYGFNGDVAKKVSKHVYSDTNPTTNQAYAINYNGWYYFSIGGNQYRFDPDTVRDDDMGDGVVSIWKSQCAEPIEYDPEDPETPLPTTYYTLQNFIHFNGDGDNGFFIGIDGDTLYQLENGNYYDLADQAIPIDVKTKDISFGQFGIRKTYSRVKPNIEKAGDWTFTLYSDQESSNIAITMASGTGPGKYIEDVSIPYTIDGKDLTLRLQNTSSVFAAIYGIALNVAGRVF